MTLARGPLCRAGWQETLADQESIHGWFSAKEVFQHNCSILEDIGSHWKIELWEYRQFRGNKNKIVSGTCWILCQLSIAASDLKGVQINTGLVLHQAGTASDMNEGWTAYSELNDFGAMLSAQLQLLHLNSDWIKKWQSSGAIGSCYARWILKYVLASIMNHHANYCLFSGIKVFNSSAKYFLLKLCFTCRVNLFLL